LWTAAEAARNDFVKGFWSFCFSERGEITPGDGGKQS